MTTPVKPVGGKQSTKQTSAEFQEEQAHYARYVAECRLLPPANSEANSRLHRQVACRYQPSLLKTFKELGLPVFED